MNEENKVIEQTEDNPTANIADRLKSWAVWAAMLGLVGMLLNTFGVFDKIGLDSMEWDAIVAAVGTILVSFGIVNNPTDRKHF